MMRSMYSGVSGLRIHQTKMDVIGNNISNVNTLGFKSSSVHFTDVLYQTTQSASGPNANTGTVGSNAMQIGLGATVGAIAKNMKAGSSQRTDNALDVMINGDPFFIVNNGSTNYFTKAGSFTIDANGTLCTASGAYAVMGWLPNEDGTECVTDNVKKLDVMSPENLYTPPAATSKAHFTGNVDPGDSELANGKEVTVPIYDNIGREYTIKFEFKKSGTDTSNNNTYSVTLKDIVGPDKKSIGAVGNNQNAGNNAGPSYSFSFGTNGVATLGFDGTNGSFYGVSSGTTLGTTKDKTLELTISGNPNCFETIEIDFSKLTSYATSGASTMEGQRGGTDHTGAGKAVGNMNGISIEDSGKIFGSYDNGDRKLLGQIAVATFANPAGLEAVGNSMYSATLNSGEFNGVGKAVKSVGSSLTSGVLEMSNVDLATEFTEMIVAQRGYQANSRIISTSDTLLEELINLKR